MKVKVYPWSECKYTATQKSSRIKHKQSVHKRKDIPDQNVTAPQLPSRFSRDTNSLYINSENIVTILQTVNNKI